MESRIAALGSAAQHVAMVASAHACGRRLPGHAGRPRHPPRLVESLPPPLGDRERDVTRLAVEGLTNREIARHLHVSPHTVNYYLRRIYHRLNINSRVQLAAYANAHAS